MNLDKVESGCTIVDQSEDSNDEEEKLPIVRKKQFTHQLSPGGEKTCNL